MKKIFLCATFSACVCTNVISMSSDDQKEVENWEKSKILIQEITGTADDCWNVITRAKDGDVKAQSAICKILKDDLVLDLSYVIVVGFLEKNSFCTDLVKTSWKSQKVALDILFHCVSKHYFSCIEHLLFGTDQTAESLLTFVRIDDISVLEQMWGRILKGAHDDNGLCYAVINYVYSNSLNLHDDYYEAQRESIESDKGLLNTILRRFPRLSSQRDLFMEMLQH